MADAAISLRDIWRECRSACLQANDVVLVDWEHWLEYREEFIAWQGVGDDHLLGVRVRTHTPLEDIAIDARWFRLIVLRVESHSDGRVFSLGRSLRARHGFGGELHAEGDILPDQIDALRRCGFDEVALENGLSPAAAPKFLTRFYQPNLTVGRDEETKKQ